MKKNAMLKIAAILMVAVLLTTCAISSTFAKYTTSDKASDVARVARFGVDVTVEFDAFKTSYATETTKDGKAADNNTVVAVAKASESTYQIYDVVAPGTAVSVPSAVTVEGTPEVDVRVTYDATIVLTGWETTKGQYCPIVFTIGDDTYTFDSNETKLYNSVASWGTYIADCFKAKSLYFDAGSTTDITADLTFGWSWAFSTSDANDKLDTELGELADDGTAPTISVELSVDVTQVD